MIPDPRAKPEPPTELPTWPPACKDCIYWLRLPANKTPSNRLGKVSFQPVQGVALGQCRFLAPMASDTPWPYCYDVDWCGQYSLVDPLTAAQLQPRGVID